MTIPVVSGLLEMRFYIPDNVIALSPRVSIACRVDGQAVVPQVYSSSGRHSFGAELPRDVRRVVQVDFEVSHALAGDDEDQRERAIVVAQISC